MEKLTRFFEIIIEVFSIIKIVASLFILGIFLGIVCYALKTDTIGLVLGIIIALTGLICGIFLARSARKNGSALEFNSRINASPDFDEIAKKGKDLKKRS